MVVSSTDFMYNGAPVTSTGAVGVMGVVGAWVTVTVCDFWSASFSALSAQSYNLVYVSAVVGSTVSPLSGMLVIEPCV